MNIVIGKTKRSLSITPIICMVNLPFGNPGARTKSIPGFANICVSNVKVYERLGHVFWQFLYFPTNILYSISCPSIMPEMITFHCYNFAFLCCILNRSYRLRSV